MTKILGFADLTWITNELDDHDLGQRFIRYRPLATKTYTVEELEKMGFFGYYTIKNNA